VGLWHNLGESPSVIGFLALALCSTKSSIHLDKLILHQKCARAKL
jgi:hypothetical protein